MIREGSQKLGRWRAVGVLHKLTSSSRSMSYRKMLQLRKCSRTASYNRAFQGNLFKANGVPWEEGENLRANHALTTKSSISISIDEGKVDEGSYFLETNPIQIWYKMHVRFGQVKVMRAVRSFVHN